MDKDLQLLKIAEEIKKCEECKANKSGLPVPGEGSAAAEIVFVGEAPGKQEAKSGKPFIGRSGKLLRDLIKRINLKENEVFITSAVKYLPDYGTPKRTDIEHGSIHLLKQLKIINPRIIVLLGSVAIQAVLGEKISVIKNHGKVIKKNSKEYFLTLHPSAALRFPYLYKRILDDFEKLKILIKRKQ